MTTDFLIYHDEEEWLNAAAGYICQRARVCMRKKGLFTMSLSGGSTPKPLYELLASNDYSRKLDWQRVHLFWGDERMVPRNHSDSNYRMVHGTLVSKVNIPEENVHPIPVENVAPERAAIEYEEGVRRFEFDLIILGMGDDGHAASLFPGDPALDEHERWVVSVDGSRGVPPVPRVTLTLPAINSAHSVMFLVRGVMKARIVDEIRHDPVAAANKYPAALVEPKEKLAWFLLK